MLFGNNNIGDEKYKNNINIKIMPDNNKIYFLEITNNVDNWLCS